MMRPTPSKFWAEAPPNCWLLVDYQVRIVTTATDLPTAMDLARSRGNTVLIWSPPEEATDERARQEREKLAA